MPDSDEDLERRLAAVERALDGDDENERSTDPRDDLGSRIATLESRVDELDAAVQAVRGFLGGVSAVNEAVERRADAAVAAVERLEARLDGESAVAIEPAPPEKENADAPSTGGGSADHDDEATADDGPTGHDEPAVDDDPSVDDDPTAQGLRERLRGLR